jgi:serine/threonine protein kinase
MIESEIVSGQQTTWSLQEKLGEGDAGEVYRVEALVGAQTAILKRPRKSAFSGDVSRQAAQIRTEGKILAALSAALRAESGLQVGVPDLLDQSKTAGNYFDQNFIVLEEAAGFDLSFLARVTQLGLPEGDGVPADLSQEEAAFLQGIAQQRQIPSRILITILSRLLGLLQHIHSLRTTAGDEETWGIIWNDIKADHLFWDPRRSRLTIIDWGNAQFLEADRTTKDRKFSWVEDYRQLYDEMGRFLTIAAPGLAERIGWPVHFSVEYASSDGVETLKARLEAALLEEDQALAETRAKEEGLLRGEATGEDMLAELEAVQQQLIQLGESPNTDGLQEFARSYAARLAMQDRLDELRSLCTWAGRLSGTETGAWALIDRLAQIPGRSEGTQRKLFLEAIQAALCADWESLLWNILLAIRDYPEPDWWQDLVQAVREQALGPDARIVRPFVAVRRLTLALQSTARRIQDHSSTASEEFEQIQGLVNHLKGEIIPNWTLLDPGPPHSGLLYSDVEDVLSADDDLFPEECQMVWAALAQPKALVQQVVAAWSAEDFLSASRGLRRVLVWDPDRRRVLHAEQALQAAPEWLKTVHMGPQPDENFPDWITRLEFRGRELRNQVGPAGWLDAVLETCRKIRKGIWPADLLTGQPNLLREMPWLAKFARSERVPCVPAEELVEEAPAPLPELAALQGVVSGRVSPGADLDLIEPLDAWMPEARGSSARVLLGQLLTPSGDPVDAAIKLMRMDKVNYATPLFIEEVKVLAAMQDVPGVTRLLECGFIQLDEGSQLPLDGDPKAVPPAGSILRIGLDASQEFISQLGERIEAGWTPYLALMKEKNEDSLLMLCDAGVTRGQFLPMIHLLQMSIQICDILEVAHARNIVYRDHKILHYYWRAEKNGIYIIDWNVARLHPEGLTDLDIHMDLVQFGARGLHHILTGRAAPGALPLGPTRPEEIEQAAKSYQTQWTYDDQRLSEGLRFILERALAGEYATATALRDDLKRTMMQLPDARIN